MAIKIKNGKTALELKKSNNLVGLRTNAQLNEQYLPDYILKQYHPNLGGFAVVRLDKGQQDIDRKLDEVRTYNEVNVGTHVYYAEGGSKPIIPTGDLFIEFHVGTSPEEQALVWRAYKLKLKHRIDEHLVQVQVSAASPNPLKVANRLENIALVKWAEPDIDIPLDEYDFAAPEDDLLPHQWHLRNEGFVIDTSWRLKKDADAKVLDAWKRLGKTGSTAVTVAVIDNGFDLNHPDLRSNIHHPYNVWEDNDRPTQNDPTYTHGTPCASVAIASANGTGMVGVAPNARFMPVHGTSFSASATRRMFRHCMDNGADIISCSWGTTDPGFALNNMKERIIAEAATKGRNGKGCIILFAVGNSSLDYVNFYAAHPNVIAVGASTSRDEHAEYSNSGKQLSVVAPSNGNWPILAARAAWDEGLSWETGVFRFYRDGKDRGSRYKHFGGTSSACPLVAGVCALILAANPELTAVQVKDILQKTADKIGPPSAYDARGHSPKFGYGRVNADRAVAEALRLREANTTQTTRGDVATGISKGKGLFRFGVEKQAPIGWGIQIGAFADYGNVLIQAERLQAQFNAPVIVNINELNGRTVYKMVLGAFNEQRQARQLAERMKQAGVEG
ncbi:MAG: S8 family serine peptidase, partial [Bacteroidota bacterium]